MTFESGTDGSSDDLDRIEVAVLSQLSVAAKSYVSGGRAQQVVLSGRPGHLVPQQRLRACWTVAVDSLRGPLEADVQEAASACWRLEEGALQVCLATWLSRGCVWRLTASVYRQVRSTFGFGHGRTVKVVNALHDVISERELLDPALARWQDTAQGSVASTALDLLAASHRLTWLVHRCISLSSCF